MVQTPPRSTIPTAPRVTWEALPDDFVLPDDPVDNLLQPALAAALTDALGDNDRLPATALVATNFGLVATINQKTTVKAPDWLFVPSAHPVNPGVIRRSYTPNLDGEPVAVVMEFLSDTEGGELSVRSTFPYGKLYFYEHILKVPTYVTYDPYALQLEVRRLQGGSYQLESPQIGDRVWIPELDLFLGLWEGTRLNLTTHWLRWWDQSGNLLLWSSEQAAQERQRAEQANQQAAQERQRAEQLAAQLRQLGVDPEQL